jgi:hypothetical protein
MARTFSKSAGFFQSNHLVIVTESRVQSWDKSGLRTIFTSGSNGILAAKESNDGLGTLAIADRHLVLLHEVTKGMEKSYKLKGAEVRDVLLRRCGAINSNTDVRTQRQKSKEVSQLECRVTKANLRLGCRDKSASYTSPPPKNILPRRCSTSLQHSKMPYKDTA